MQNNEAINSRTLIMQRMNMLHQNSKFNDEQEEEEEEEYKVPIHSFYIGQK